MKWKLLILAAGLMVSAMIISCSTEEPWSPEPSRPLSLVMISAPDTATMVPDSTTVSFFWSATGGTGEKTYQWYLSPLQTDYGSQSNRTDTTYTAVLAVSDTSTMFTFNVRARDETNSTDAVTTSFTVSPAVPPAPDTTAPTVAITQSPIEGSYVASGTSIAFAWEGDDGKGNLDVIEYQYAFPTLADSSGWVVAASVSFTNVQPADPAFFFVRARDQALNYSDWDSTFFIIKNATILYVDDFLWTDAFGNPVNAKERNQKQFYRDALAGYAFAEWDIALQGMPDSSDLVQGGLPVYNVILFASDSDQGTTDGTWWFEVGAVGGGVMKYYMENGGKLLVTGSLTLLDMTQAYPPEPVPGDFEYDWLGIDSTEWCWDYWFEFSWAVKDPSTTLDLPDSTRIDVSKHDPPEDYAIETPGLRQETGVVTNEVIYLWGLFWDQTEPTPYLHPVGHVTYFADVPKTAMLNFDTYSMPQEDMRQTFQAILGLFGE